MTEKNNDQYQLIMAVQELMWPEENMTFRRDHPEPPVGWSLDAWIKLINKPYQERLIVCATLLAAEYDRVEEREVSTTQEY